jgi:hypothetical protein
MPLPLAPLIAFTVGVLLAWLSRTETNHDEPLWNDSARAVVLYALFVFAPVTAYFAAFATDWSFAYLVDGRHVPSALSLALVLLAASAVVGGFFAGRRALERRAPSELVWLAGCPVALVLVAVAAAANRLSIDATYDQFANDFGLEPLVTSRLGVALVWMDGIVVAGAVLTARKLAPGEQPRQTAPAPVLAAPVDQVDHGEGPARFLGREGTRR